MNWYLQNGKNSDVVLSSRVRLARNIRGIPFTAKASEEDCKKVHDLMKGLSYSLGYGLKFIEMKDMDDISKRALAEKHLISKRFANTTKKYRAIIINDEENICIEVNGEDHIKLQTFCSGDDLQNLLALAIEIDKKIESCIPYAFHEKYGYLTACPKNVGTGLKASVLVHLPALHMGKTVQKIIDAISNFGMSVTGLYGEGSKPQGAIYQVANNQSLGITEKEIIKNLKLIAQKLVEQEKSARSYLANKSIRLEDKVYRDFGVLTNARKLSEEETLELISSVKLGTDLGIINEINDTKVSKMMVYTKSANLQKYLGQELNVYDQETERAKLIKQILSE